mgnify:CR=1 FL=1
MSASIRSMSARKSVSQVEQQSVSPQTPIPPRSFASSPPDGPSESSPPGRGPHPGPPGHLGDGALYVGLDGVVAKPIRNTWRRGGTDRMPVWITARRLRVDIGAWGPRSSPSTGTSAPSAST